MSDDAKRFHRLEFASDGPSSFDVTAIKIDGMELKGVTSIRIECAGPGGDIQAHVSLYAEMAADVLAKVGLTAEPDCIPTFREYVRMAWGRTRWRLGRWYRARRTEVARELAA